MELHFPGWNSIPHVSSHIVPDDVDPAIICHGPGVCVYGPIHNTAIRK